MPSLKRYGLTQNLWDVMIVKQNNKCAICYRPFGTNVASRPNVDHDHKTKKIRGLLCNSCNRGIGFLKDNISVVSAALKYLRHPIVKNLLIVPPRSDRPYTKRHKLTVQEIEDICNWFKSKDNKYQYGDIKKIALKYSVSPGRIQSIRKLIRANRTDRCI
jgi:hypothetical protein